MKKDDFEQAKMILERIDEYERLDAAIRIAAQTVKNFHNESDAEDIAQLIMKLVETKDGERVIDHIVCSITLKFEQAKRELQRRFEDL